MEGRLYKKAFGRHLLRCLGKSIVEYVLREVHEGCCRSYIGGQTLHKKILLTEYYWSTLENDATRWVTIYICCKRDQNLTMQPVAQMAPIIAICPFEQGGLDIVGPFSLGPS